MTPFTDPITPDDVAELIDFTVADNPDTASMAKMQREGRRGALQHPVQRFGRLPC